MSLSLSIALYFIIWWIVLFAVLPFGVRTQDEAGSVVPGTPGSAPANPAFFRIFVTTTLAAAVVFGMVYWVIAARIISLDAIGPPIAR